jgi:hypothetical protein
MKSRILALAAICVAIVVSLAFTMPNKKQSKKATAATKTEDNSAAPGGFAFDPKD